MVVGVVVNQKEVKELWAHRDQQLKSRQQQGKIAMKSAVKKEETKKRNALKGRRNAIESKARERGEGEARTRNQKGKAAIGVKIFPRKLRKF